MPASPLDSAKYYMFNFLRPAITVATHNGKFHADDVFAVATLSLWADKERRKITVVRTRDPVIINKADIAVDVGFIYDASKNRFDHHQKGGAGKHDNDIPYASFGLVWKHYGQKLCPEDTANIVEKKLVIPIDAQDNGINLSDYKQHGFSGYTLDDAVDALRLAGGDHVDTVFARAVNFGKEILKGEINNAKAEISGMEKTEVAIKEQGYPTVLVLDKYIKWGEAARKYESIKFVVYLHNNGNDWCVQSVMGNPNDYTSDRIKFPHDWWGVEGEELAKISGIQEAMFCSNQGWFATAKTKEAAIEMAKKALKVSGSVLI
jgi:uncharacterized UPF0160 family protein